MTLQEAFAQYQARPQTLDAYAQSQGLSQLGNFWGTQGDDGFQRSNQEDLTNQFGQMSDPNYWMSQANDGRLMSYAPGTSMDQQAASEYATTGMQTVRDALKQYDPGFQEGNWLAAGTEQNPFDRPAYLRSENYDYGRDNPVTETDYGPYMLMALAALGGGAALMGGGFGGAGAASAGGVGASTGELFSALGAAGSGTGTLSAEALASILGGGGASSLPASYWSMLAEGGGATTDAAAAGAGSFGSSGFGGSSIADMTFPAAAGGTNFTAYPGLSLESLGTAGGLSTIPGAGLSMSALGSSGGGSMDWLSELFTPKNLLSAGTQLGSAYLQNNAIDKAVDAQTGAADRATAATMAMYNQNRADLEPWRTAGGGAVTRLADLLKPGNQVTAMEMDPGYQFRLAEGMKALERSAAYKGKLFSGQTGKAITKYGQDFATGEFTNVANRLSNLAGLGQTSATNTANLGASAANQQSNNIIGAGNARASGYVGTNNAYAGALSNFLKGMQENEMVDLLRRSYG